MSQLAWGWFDPVKPPDERIRSVDGLRATAFLLVFAFHSWEFAGRPHVPVVGRIIAENTRPDLFIVLTGFALYLPFARDPGRLTTFRSKNYFVRRLRRLVPPYYAALALALGLPHVLKAGFALVGRETDPEPALSAGNIVSHLTFTHLFFKDHWAGINGSLWTMSLEMQLYLLFPVVAFAVARWGLRVLAPLAVAGVAYRVAVGRLVDGPSFPDHFLWGATAIGRLTEFAAGVFAAVVALRYRRRFGRAQVLAALSLFLGFYIVATESAWSASRAFPVRDTALAIAFGALVVLAIASRPVEAMFAWKPVSMLGFMSYSMFLVHQPMVYFLSELLKRVVGLPEGVGLLLHLWTIGLGIVLMVGYVMFRLVEAPSMKWSRSAKRRIDAAPVAARHVATTPR